MLIIYIMGKNHCKFKYEYPNIILLINFKFMQDNYAIIKTKKNYIGGCYIIMNKKMKDSF